MIRIFLPLIVVVAIIWAIVAACTPSCDDMSHSDPDRYAVEKTYGGCS